MQPNETYIDGTYVFDIETNGLLQQLDRVHCIVITDYYRGDVWQYGPHELQAALERLSAAKTLIGHNIIGFDLPALKKALNWFPDDGVQILDTLILSKYDDPDRQLPTDCPTTYKTDGGKNKRIGSHSLAAFGFLLGQLKPEHNDWQNYSSEMLHRCTEDVHINKKTCAYLLRNIETSLYSLLDLNNRKTIFGGTDAKSYSVFSPVYSCKPSVINGFWLEIEFAKICQQQMERMCKIDVDKLYYNISELTQITSSIADQLESSLGLYANCTQPKIGYGTYERGRIKKLAETSDSLAVEQSLFSIAADTTDINQAISLIYQLLQHSKGKLTKSLQSIATMLDEVRHSNGKRVFVKKPFKKNGTLSAQVENYCEESGIDKDQIVGQFTKVSFDQVRLSQREKICTIMLRRGWQPSSYTEFTEKGGGGNPQLTIGGEPCPGLAKVEGGLGQDYITWVQATKRLEMHEAFRDNMDENGMIPALVDSVGTNTYRVKHRLIANLPRAGGGTFYGTETRSVISVPDGYKMLGADMSGLENRVAGHYTTPLDEGKYATEVLEGDCHTQFRLGMVELLGNRCPDVLKDAKEGRNVAKTLTYAILYGASAHKIATVLDVSDNVGKKCVEAFWKVNDALAQLKQLCGDMHDKHGYIIGIDGRKVRTRSSHSAMNCLFQSAGSIIFKLATVAAQHKAGGKLEQIITYHDENQWQVPAGEVKTTKPMSILPSNTDGVILSVPKSLVDGTYECQYHAHGELFVQAARYAGRLLRCNVEFDAEYAIGDNWAQTH